MSSPRNLYYLDVTNKDSRVEWMLVNTVQANFEGFTRHEVEKANKAQRLKGMIGNLTKREFAGMVCENSSPIALLLSTMSTTLTVFLVLTSLIQWGRQLGQSQNA
jgi:hypothetical protein